MKGLKSLIQDRRRQEHADSEIRAPPKVTKLPSNSSVEGELQQLSQYYADTSERRKRPREDENNFFTSAKRAAADRLSNATRILMTHGEPLKLFGESPSDIIARADACTAEFRGQVYDSIPAIDVNQSPNELLLSFIRTCFALWGERIINGKEDARIYNSSQKAMTPLIAALRSNSLDSEMLAKLHRSAVHCVRGEYKDAHTAYISLAVGDAPWPMGVTMVGIHERVGRSRIAASEITHVLDDEPTCRFIQVFKRLLSLCQIWYPVRDMSQMVLLSSVSFT